MRRAVLLSTALLVTGLCLRCGPPPLEGMSFNEIQLEGEQADEVEAALERGLTGAGVTLNQADAPNLVGEVTWAWAGEGGTRYPTEVEIDLRAEPAADDGPEAWAKWAVPQGGQPQDVPRYAEAIAERVVSILSAQRRDTES